MRRIHAIALNTFRETIRDRILGAIVLFAVVLIASSLLLGTLSAGQDVKIVKDLGLAAIGAFGAIIAIFVGTSLVSKELNARTVFVVLTKPVSRASFLWGKALGLLATLTVLVVAMGLSYGAILAFMKVPFSIGFVQAAFFVWLELVLLTALTLLFSTFTTPVLAMLYATAIYVIGHNAPTLLQLADQAQGPTRALLKGLYYALPNLATFDLKNQVVYGYVASPAQTGLAALYALAYASALFGVAVFVFSKREF